MTKKTTRALQDNAGISQAYSSALRLLAHEMAESVTYWMSAQYKKEPPIAMDARGGYKNIINNKKTPAREANKRLKELAKKWAETFAERADNIAKNFLLRQMIATETGIKSALKEEFRGIKFHLTPVMRDVMQAKIAENVSLIKSIPDQYLQRVEGVIMRAYSRGMNMQGVSDELIKIGRITRKRADFIARDQIKKVHESVQAARYKELGFDDAVWIHARGGKHPRQDHKKAHGRKFKLIEGCYISGEYIMPGQLPNCGCTFKVVLSGKA